MSKNTNVNVNRQTNINGKVSASQAKANLRRDISFLINDRCANAIDEAFKIKAEDFCFDETFEYVPEMF